MLEASTATDVSVVGSSFVMSRPGVHSVLIDDGAAERTFRVFMARHRVTGLWGMSCTCDHSLIHHPALCKHACHLLLRVVRLRDPRIYIDVGRARHAAVTTLLHFMSARDGAELRPWPEVARPCQPPPREDVAPRDPTDECPVCYEEFSDGRCVRCGRCSRLFHRACVERWAKSCPTCRDPVQFADLAPTRSLRTRWTPTGPAMRWAPASAEAIAAWDDLSTGQPPRYVDADSEDSYSLTSLDSDGQHPEDPYPAGYVDDIFPPGRHDAGESESGDDDDDIPQLEEEAEPSHE